VPGFLEAAKELRAKGVDQVYVVSTADGKSIKKRWMAIKD